MYERYSRHEGVKGGEDAEIGMLGRVSEGARMSYEEWDRNYGDRAKRQARRSTENNYEDILAFLRKHQMEDRGFPQKSEFVQDLQPTLQEKLADTYGQDIRLGFLTAVHSRVDYMGADAVFTLSFLKKDTVEKHNLLWGVTTDPEKHNPERRQKSALPAHLDFLVPPDGWLRPQKNTPSYERDQKTYEQALDTMSELLFNRFQEIVSHSGKQMDVFTQEYDVREDMVRDFQNRNQGVEEHE